MTRALRGLLLGPPAGLMSLINSTARPAPKFLFWVPWGTSTRADRRAEPDPGLALDGAATSRQAALHAKRSYDL